MTATLTTRRAETTVGMGQIAVLTGDERASAVLGSCVGVAIYDEKKKLGALAHIVLPTSAGRPGTPGKFVDTAIVWMINELRSRGADPRKLTCKLTGGATMFATNGPFQIGQQNIDATRQTLAAANVRIVAEHLGGAKGRRITFECDAFKVVVESAGEPSVTL
jgi:chemotaxis protein CheD